MLRTFLTSVIALALSVGVLAAAEVKKEVKPANKPSTTAVIDESKITPKTTAVPNSKVNPVQAVLDQKAVNAKLTKQILAKKAIAKKLAKQIAAEKAIVKKLNMEIAAKKAVSNKRKRSVMTPCGA